ncbi:geranylgeranyl reductase family protein [Nitrospira sp. MA-1]|nr:geranylgeranyl reductase family protein [Nitrospira sp. MA-1]
MTYDVIVVGAGPGGSSTAAFTARKGLSTLILDRTDFPRDKVCGDGLTPQALYWLDQLGCIDEVLTHTKSCIKTCDLFINGELLLTGGFPNSTQYPDFCVLLDRRRFDHILLQHAVDSGAKFQAHSLVREIHQKPDHARVVLDHKGQRTEVQGKIVIGADGVSSVVSRSIGNVLKNGATALSLRAYYQNVDAEGAQIKVYFDERFFPGYAWVFVDDDGFANIGLGYAFDKPFPMIPNLKQVFQDFLDHDLGHLLRHASRCGAVSGGAVSFFKPKAIVADRVMLVGDAANQADPLNGGGIHKAMEGAYLAAETAHQAVLQGDCSVRVLQQYQMQWEQQFDLDWRTGELFLSVAKNPDLKEFCLFVLANIARMTTHDRQFQEFCSGVFSGVLSQNICLVPQALFHAMPRNPAAWLAMLQLDEKGVVTGPLSLATDALTSSAKASSRMLMNPWQSLNWSLEVMTKVLRLARGHAEGSLTPTGTALTKCPI